MKTSKIIFCLLLFSLAFPAYIAAENISGITLARKIFNREMGKDSRATAQMVLISKTGIKRVREFTIKRIRENSLDSRIIRFTSPADIDGTGFLTIEKTGGETEQFLYLPALRRTRRIVSSQKSQKFVNSDFTYEDMERHPVNNYEYKITGSQKIGALDCYVLEARPKKGINSQYSLTVSSISKQTFVPVLVKYFDGKGSHIKTYKVLKLDLIQDIWTEMVVSVENHEKGTQTYVRLSDIQYNKGIPRDQISPKALEAY